MSEALVRLHPLPIGSTGRHASGWWGMVALVLTEASLFAYLLFSYFYLASHSVGQWPPDGPPDMTLSIPGTVILLAGSLVMWWGERGIERSRSWQLIVGLAAALVLGVSFIFLELRDWKREPFTLSTNVYSSLYFTITGFHLLHVAIGLLILATLLVWTALGYFDPKRHSAVSIGGLYWHFVTVVWVAVFFTFYIAPRLS